MDSIPFRRVLRVLLVEDYEHDARLLVEELERGGFEAVVDRVEEEAAFRAALREGRHDVVIADYHLPRFSGLAALGVLRQEAVDLPLILVSGTVGEEVAVEGMRAGAHDYILKDNLTRLVPAVERELREAARRRKHHEAEVALWSSEREYRQLVQSVPGVVFRCRRDGAGRWSFPFISEGAEALLGVPVQAMVADAAVFVRRVARESRRLVWRSMSRALSRLSLWTCEFAIVRPDGGKRWVRAQAMPSKDGVGVVWTGVLIDITDRKGAEEEKERLEWQLRQAQKLEAIGTLAGGIAHDFNNILAAIIPYTHLAKADAGDNVLVQESLDEVLRAAERAKSLVKQILTFSCQHRQERRPMPLQPVVREVLKLMRHALPGTIQIDAEIQAEAPAVLAEPTQIHQVLMNLCTNAAHAMRHQSGRLRVALQAVAVAADPVRGIPDLRPGPYVRLTVADTGHGMDTETRKRIFDPFFTTKQPGEGTGLGLSVVHGILREHGGVVRVDSAPGAGTVFELYFPQCAVGDTEALRVSAPPLPMGAGERVLFVDDERVLCDVAQRMLTRLGYRVTAEVSPVAALARVKSAPRDYDLVFTDLTMPGMTGVDLAAAVLRIRPDVPVVLAAGQEGGWTTDSAQRLGIRAVVSKPLDLPGVARLLREVLGPVGNGER